MVIIETSIFTRQVLDMLTDEEYRSLQIALLLQPDLGLVITGGGGLRKVRWGVSGRGKRGGLRVIYYWEVYQERILMLFLYAKNAQEDLTAEQLKVLRRLVEEEYYER